MEYRIAIASTDGKVVNQHFGHTEEFVIVKVEDNKQYYFSEKRKVTPPCNAGEHDEKTLNTAIEALSDCKYVLCSQIGRGAETSLRSKGITPFEIAHFIEYAIKKIVIYDEKTTKWIH